MERTLVILKPDAVQRGLIGQITARLEQRGIKLVGMRLILIDDELAAAAEDVVLDLDESVQVALEDGACVEFVDLPLVVEEHPEHLSGIVGHGGTTCCCKPP